MFRPVLYALLAMTNKQGAKLLVSDGVYLGRKALLLWMAGAKL